MGVEDQAEENEMTGEPLKIGELVNKNVTAILRMFEEAPQEFGRLREKDYTSQTFGLAFPMPRAIDLIEGTGDHHRYWKPTRQVAESASE